jgi:hypothetical protein
VVWEMRACAHASRRCQALHLASKHGVADMISHLVALGADVNGACVIVQALFSSLSAVQPRQVAAEIARVRGTEHECHAGSWPGPGGETPLYHLRNIISGPEF